MNAPSQSLWLATASPIPALPSLLGEVRTQVLIIGAGYTGLSAALHLAQEQRRVVVLDAAELGVGASGLNGGQVIPGVKHDPEELEALFGASLAARMIETVASGPDLVFSLIGRHGIACDAVRTGWIQAATSAAAMQAITRRVAQWHARGAPVSLLDRNEVAQLLGSERYVGGWLDRRGGSVQPLSYARGLASAALEAGAQIFVRSPAISWEHDAHGWHVRTPTGRIVADSVVLATNACTGAPFDVLRRSVVPIPSFQVATEPLSAAQLERILPQRQPISDTWRLLRYFRLDAHGRLVLGSRGFFGGATIAKAARLHYRAAREIYPALRDVRFDYHWGGMVAMTADHLPHLHRLHDQVWAGLGYNGRGVAMATMMGRLLAQCVLGVPESQLGFPVRPVQAIRWHRFARLGARVAVTGLQWLDRAARASAPHRPNVANGGSG